MSRMKKLYRDSRKVTGLIYIRAYSNVFFALSKLREQEDSAYNGEGADNSNFGVWCDRMSHHMERLYSVVDNPHVMKDRVSPS